MSKITDKNIVLSKADVQKVMRWILGDLYKKKDKDEDDKDDSPAESKDKEKEPTIIPPTEQKEERKSSIIRSKRIKHRSPLMKQLIYSPLTPTLPSTRLTLPTFRPRKLALPSGLALKSLN